MLAWDVYELGKHFLWTGGQPNLIGWVLNATCEPRAGRERNVSIVTCSTLAIRDNGSSFNPDPNATARSWWRRLGPNGSNPGEGIYQPTQAYRKVAGAPYVSPSHAAYPGARPNPSVQPAPKPWYPAVDPFVIPPNQPGMPTPSPLPRGPARDPWSGPEDGNWSDRGYRTNPRPRVAPRIDYKPTPPREKERKSIVKKGAAIVLKGGYAVTEGVDFIEALHDGVGPMPAALPKEYQAPKGANAWEKARAIYEHWDKVNLDQALLNLAANQLIDLAVGVPSGQASDFLSRHGITHGGLTDGFVRGV